jgi:hypothetical protein
MEPITITALPDYRFTISTDPQSALSEVQLRERLAAMNTRADIIERLINLANTKR